MDILNTETQEEINEAIDVKVGNLKFTGINTR